MARPKGIAGDKRDGFVNFRLPPEITEGVNCLCFLLGKSAAEVAHLALADLIAKHEPEVNQLRAIKAAHLKGE